MDSHIASQYLANINHLQDLQEKVKFYEQSNDYHNGMDAFVAYIEYVRSLQQPLTLITLYIRFAKFCLMNNDTLFARDLYKEAKILISTYESDQNLAPKKETLSHPHPLS
ncbi:hypothetical protein NEF87_003513 [Candidatus Lokiarchaeum ossiferum]|uniref:Uncharacterized protein n=1 Tax=Candidatus Lokiarchaeum ossiferum TaxID=2951803 RepID=A0ABY6HUM8_9ARCH|nr:hypothetical protein NEF87_003513 [Candidatus Lokiarchaeum sp. B-35]